MMVINTSKVKHLFHPRIGKPKGRVSPLFCPELFPVVKTNKNCDDYFVRFNPRS